MRGDKGRPQRSMKLIRCLIRTKMVFIQLDVGSFLTCSMPGESVKRQVNTSYPKTQKNNFSWNQKPEPARFKKTGSLLSVPTKGLCPKSPPGWFGYCLSFGKELYFCEWELASEILTCESCSWMAQPNLNSSSSTFGAFPLVWRVSQQDLRQDVPIQGGKN